MAFPIDSIDVLARLIRGENGDASAAPRIWHVGLALNAPSTLRVALRHLFSKPGETRQLAIERDGKRMAIALALTKRL